MKYLSLSTLAVALIGVAPFGSAQVFNLAGLPGSSMQFNGTSSTFQFNPAGVDQWRITSGGSAVGLQGGFGGGPYTYGAITTVGLLQSAPVSTTGTFFLNDGSGFQLTGNINWQQVSTFAAVGGLNSGALINLSGLSYGGTNPDLISFAAAGIGTLTVSFQFTPGQTLQQLTSGTGPYMTSFSGTLVAVPEPTSLALIGLGFVLFSARRRLVR